MRSKIRVTLPVHPLDIIAPQTHKSIEQLKKSNSFEVRSCIVKNACSAFAKNEGINNNRSDKKYQQIYDYAYILIVENGVAFTEETIDGLFSHNVDIVGSINAQDDSQAVMAGKFGVFDGLIVEEKRCKNGETGIQQVDWINTGLLLIKATAIARMAYPWFRQEIVEYTGEFDKEHCCVTDENIGFCINAKRSGIGVFCDFDNPIRLNESIQKVKGISQKDITDVPVACPVCNWRGEKFLDVEYDDNVYKNAECPKCLSHPRQRLFAKFWEHTFRSDFVGRLLHISPAPCEEEFIRKVTPAVAYLSTDIDPLVGIDHEDITAMSYADESFDVIVCLHVLEHIPEDRKAMREIGRILKKEGVAIIMIPLNRFSDTTFEDSSIVDPKQRMKAFWHWDHVRLYGNDFTQRLIGCGFDVATSHFITTFTLQNRKKYGFDEFEPIFVCRKTDSMKSV